MSITISILTDFMETYELDMQLDEEIEKGEKKDKSIAIVASSEKDD